MAVLVERLQGPRLEAALPALAELRISVFRAWPYLYEGDLEYERDYLQAYLQPDAVLIAAYDGGTIVGASTALPLRAEPDYVVAPVAAFGLAPDSVVYLGESVLLPSHRGRGIGVRFFEEREVVARRQGRAHAVFCAVVRPAAHPARPPDFVPLDAFWHRRGYQRLPGVTTSFAWRDVGTPAETAHPMQFWHKPLAGDPAGR